MAGNLKFISQEIEKVIKKYSEETEEKFKRYTGILLEEFKDLTKIISEGFEMLSDKLSRMETKVDKLSDDMEVVKTPTLNSLKPDSKGKWILRNSRL